MKLGHFSVFLILVFILANMQYSVARTAKNDQSVQTGDYRAVDFRGSDVPYFQSYWHADKTQSGIYIEFIPSIDEIMILECKGGVGELAPCTPLYLGVVEDLCKTYNAVVDAYVLERRGLYIIGSIILTASTGGVGTLLQSAGLSSGAANTIAIMASGKSTIDAGKEFNNLRKDKCGTGQDFNLISDLVGSSLRNLALSASKEDIELVKKLFNNDEFAKYSDQDVMLYRDYRTIVDDSGEGKAEFRFSPVGEFSPNLLVWQNNLHLKLLNNSISEMLVINK